MPVRVGVALLTAQHSHQLLQDIQDLSDVHQVPGLQTLPEEETRDIKQCYSSSSSPSTCPKLRPFCPVSLKLGHELQKLSQKKRLTMVQGLQSQLFPERLWPMWGTHHEPGDEQHVHPSEPKCFLSEADLGVLRLSSTPNLLVVRKQVNHLIFLDPSVFMCRKWIIPASVILMGYHENKNEKCPELVCASSKLHSGT